jgi:hypothetical protein
MDYDMITIITRAVEKWRNGRAVETMKSVYGETVDVHGIACKIIPRPAVVGEPLRVDVELIHSGRLLHRICVELPDDQPQTIH